MVCLIVLASGRVFGQAPQFSSILAGAVFDPPSHSVRMVLGIPGAARISQVLLDGLDNAALSPDGKNGVALRQNNIIGLRRLDEASADVIDFGSVSSTLNAAWSPDSRTAVVWFVNPDGTASFHFWTAAQPVAAPVPVAFSFSSLQDVCVTADGQAALLAVRDDIRSGIYRLMPSGSTELVTQAADPAALTLDSSGMFVYYLDRALHAVERIAPNDSAGSPEVVIPNLDSSMTVTALAILKGGRLALADTSRLSVSLFDVNTAAWIRTIELSAAPDGFVPLGGSDWFIVAHRSEEASSMLLLDSRSQSVYFVPADEN